jgi:hypothetical protein
VDDDLLDLIDDGESHRSETSEDAADDDEDASKPAIVIPDRVKAAIVAKKLRVDNEQAEWLVILECFRTYKQLFGDLKIPSRFIVPSEDPWPSAGWTVKLGHKVTLIRGTGKFTENQPERRALLDEIGFAWRVRKVPFGVDGVQPGQAILALRFYKQIHGDLEVPPSYVVPNSPPWPLETRGLPLGSKIVILRAKNFLKEYPQYEKELLSIGFEFDVQASASDTRFAKIYDALKAYRAKFGTLQVPQPFTVEDGDPDFPESTWGLRLGARVYAIRSQGAFVKTDLAKKAKLDELGFVWDLHNPTVPVQKKQKNGVQEFDSSATPNWNFKGSFSSPNAPPVNDKPTWAEQTQRIHAMFASRTHAHVRVQDEEWNKMEENGFDSMFDDEDEDKVEEKPRVSRAAADSILDEFNGFSFDDVVEALEIWKREKGSFEIDPEYVIERVEEEKVEEPSSGDSDDDDDDYDDDSGEVDIKQMLAALAREAKEKEEEWNELAAEGGSEELLNGNNSTCNIVWPSYMKGMALGEIVEGIQEGNLGCRYDRAQKKVLDKLEFDWGDPAKVIPVPFAKMLCALHAYGMVRGEMLIPSDFVVPPDLPWPPALVGFPLGKYNDKLRVKKDMMFKYHEERFRILYGLDYVWMS